MELLIPLQNGGDDEFLAIGLLVVVFLGGLGLMYIGFQKYRVGRLIKNTSPERVRSIAMGRTEIYGHTRPTGTTFDAPFTSEECVYRSWEIEEEVERRVQDDEGRTKTKRSWVTIDKGSDTAPFYVEDDTGQIFVLADEGANFEISSENSHGQTLSRGRSFPSEVRSFMNNREDTVDPMDIIDASPFAEHFDGHPAETLTPSEFNRLDPAEQDILRETLPGDYIDDEGRLQETVDAQELGHHLRPKYADDIEEGGWFSFIETGSGSPPRQLWTAMKSIVNHLDMLASRGASSNSRVRRRRYSQEILPVGEEVYVFGGAELRPDPGGSNEDRLIIEEDVGSGQFIISDKDESGLVKYYNRRAPLYIVGGLALSAGTLALLLTVFGPY